MLKTCMPFTTLTASAEAKKARKPDPYKAATQMQEVLRQIVMDPKVNPQQRARAADSWDRLENRKRILRMKPEPRAVDPSKMRKVKPAAGFD